MLMEELIRRGAALGDLSPQGFQERAVRYFIAITDDGAFVTIQETRDETRKSSRGVDRLIPDMVRTSGIRPILLVDKASYVLGYRAADDLPGREVKEHEAFRNLIAECAEVTGEPALRSVVRFLEHLPDAPIEVPSDFDPEARITFRVLGNQPSEYPIDLASVRRFWASRLQPKIDGQHFECMFCGTVGPLAGVHPVTIKPIPGGQTSGNYVVSANAGAFVSYGLKGNETSPTCLGCAVTYGNTLNALLANSQSSYRTKNMVFVFWTVASTTFNPARFLSDPEPSEVRELLQSPFSAEKAASEIDSTSFFAAGLSASGSRVVVRDWIDTTVENAKRRMIEYFHLQELVDPYGGPSVPLRLGRIANATVRDPKKEAAAPIVELSLIRLAFTGSPLPMELLYLAVKRNRAEQDVNRERAVLIKMVLASQPGRKEDDAKTSELDARSTEPAYLCGRLLAILDVIQTRALNSPNATIIDKFYGTASSAPASVFGTLIHGAQAHMGKLRKTAPGTHHALERQLEDVLDPLMPFPNTLTLQEQGLFALGFYHQRAWNRRAAQLRKEQREADAAEAKDAESPPTEE